MPYNGSGVFVRLYTFVADAAANIKIRADRMDAELDGVATGLTTAITKNGTTTIVADLPMATYKHTGVGDATARTHYAAEGQVQDGKLNWVDGGGTADAITASYTIAITTLVDGQICHVRAMAANATTTPTFSPSALTARVIVKNGNQALVAGDIAGDGHELILRYRISDTKWELLNPAGSGFATLAGNNAFTGNNTFAGTSTMSGTLAMTGKAINAAKGADIASASTVNIGAATGNFIDITGTTTITAFDTVQAGTIRVLKFEGILTLTHNATSLILPTGANITTAVSDVATFVSEGAGNWRCIGYQKASGAALLTSVTTFTSTDQTITSSGPLTLPHSLGAAPFDYFCELKCTTGEFGYSIGDKLKVADTDVGGVVPGFGVSIVPDATNLNIRYGSGTTVFLGIHKTTGVQVSFTNANWVAIFKAVKF